MSPEAFDSRPSKRSARRGIGAAARSVDGDVTALREAYWQDVCFYSSPIGRDGTDQRAHADMFQSSLVEPAIKALDPGMTVVRSDELPSSSITASVIEHVVNSRLVIADLSFHNPSVLYEVGMRHGRDKPLVLISRAKDSIPANLRDFRVIKVNAETTPTFVAEMDERREQITAYSRWALSPVGRVEHAL